MIRLAGVNIPEDKRIEIALTYIYGIGQSLSGDILKKNNIDLDIVAGKLKAEELNKIREEINKLKLEGETRREVAQNIKRLIDIGSYRGIRHAKGLPVRGQRTKTNMRTVKGNKRTTMTSGRRKLEKT